MIVRVPEKAIAVITMQINTRGTFTLPSALRKALGVEHGGVVMAELENGSIVLRPATAVENYSDQRVSEFDEADAELRKHLDKTRAKRHR